MSVLPLRAGDRSPLKQRMQAAAVDQTAEAIARVNLPAAAYLRWPWPDLDALMGPMAPGTLHYIAAASSVGKTTFVTSFVDAVVAQHALYVLPLELTPAEWRTWWACFRLGIKPKDALQGFLRAAADEGDERACARLSALEAEFAALGLPSHPVGRQVCVSKLRALDGEAAYNACRYAHEFGAKAVLIDHTDELEDRQNVHQAAADVAAALHDGVRDFELIGLATTQLNREALKGDALKRYMPPRPETVLYGEVKFQKATSMVGIFRPLRSRHPHERTTTVDGRKHDPYVEAIKAARADQVEPATVLMPGVTGVVAMKHRMEGGDTGKRCHLGWDNGRLVPLTEPQRRELEAAKYAIRTGD